MLATYMRRMRNNKLEIRIEGSSCRPKKKRKRPYLRYLSSLPMSSSISAGKLVVKQPASKLSYLGKRSEPRENVRARTRSFAARSRVLARLASLAEIGELTRRLVIKSLPTRVIGVVFVYSIKSRRRFNSHAKRSGQISTSFTSYIVCNEDIYSRSPLYPKK